MRRPHPAVSRRTLLSTGGGIGLAALLAACSDDDDDGTGSAGGGTGGAFSFTDDRDETVSLDAAPQTIVAFTGTAAALWDFGVRDQIAGVFGPTTLEDGTPDPQAGDLDVDNVEILGNTWGEFDVVAYAALEPQLLITNMYDPGMLWYVPEESADQILGRAPSIALNVARVPMNQPIERYAELAAALGADPNAPEVGDARTRFETAAEAVRTAAADNPLRVLACSADPDLFYVSNPEVNTDLMYFAELGVDMVVPDSTDEGGYFESLSWENADKYPADLLLVDARGSAVQPADLTDNPAWNQLPAVAAGQIEPWHSEPRFSHAGVAPLLEALAAAILGNQPLS